MKNFFERRWFFGVFSGVLLLLLAGCAEEKSLRLLATTSTDNSGLLDYLLPKFTGETGIKVQVISQGTGMAMRLAERGDGDLLLVHAEQAELGFIGAGYGHSRRPFMYNDFLLVGPAADPAGLATAESLTQALVRLHDSPAAIFISRSDDSGTHKREMQLWQGAALDPDQGQFQYREVGSGMGKVLNVSAALDGYTLTDRGSWLSFSNRQNLIELVSGSPELFNQYSVIELDARRHPQIESRLARQLSDWLVSEHGQALIGAFRIQGQALFHPNYQSDKISQ